MREIRYLDKLIDELAKGKPLEKILRKTWTPSESGRTCAGLTRVLLSGSLGGMNAAFIAKLVLSFVVGGMWIALGVALAERRGSKAGGLVIGFPSTVLIAVVFIGWTQSAAAAVQATNVIPAIFGVSCLYLLTAITLIGRGLRTALAAALAVWGGLSALLVALKFDDYWAGVLIYAACFTFAYWRLGRIPQPSADAERVRPSGPFLIAARAVFGGSIVALAVLLAKVGGALIGGVFAIFPAVFTGALVATAVSHGPGFSAALMRSTLVGGISVIVFTTAVRLSYGALGLIQGTIVSIIAPLASTVIIGMARNFGGPSFRSTRSKT
jgi:uncharacterized membrane protein (GlpM family)